MELSSARHAFVTGGASGIGLGIVDALTQHGISVTIADIDRQAVEAVTAERSPAICGVGLDVRDRDSWAQAKADAESVFGPVDILVNNAGIGFNGRDVVDTDADVFDLLVAIDLAGVFHGVTAFGAQMRDAGHGHIVNTASVRGLTAGAPGRGAYSAVKSAVVSLSEALRAEMASHGVGVSVLCPGLVRSNLDANTTRLGGHVEDASHIKGAGDVGMTPAAAGACVVRGIAEDLPYIVTHPEYLGYIEKRMDAIRAAVEAVAAVEIGSGAGPVA
ncbi:MAG: SDR family oxidoreductase [Rhodococcus sp. (in: high G+C Gram-positive bacteria)]|uniref:SDR family oxidoreductase n=1 Tax=Rhodococcus sp. TaxID=1831 RepID=UPI003D9B9287